MIDWLFGGKKGQEKAEQQKNKTIVQTDNTWALEYVGSYLSSPLWRIPVLNFLENNCLVFEDSQENLFEYTTIFEKFRQLVSGLVNGIMNEVGISQQLLQQCISKGLKTKRRRLFEQLLVCDNFLAFKKVMVKKNKQLQIQALKQLAKQDSNFKIQNKKSQMDLHRMQMEKAIALSQALAAKLQEQEQRMIQQAIKESQEQQRRKQQKESKSKSKLLQKLPQIPFSKQIPFGSSLLDQKSIDQLVKDRNTIIQQTKKIQKSEQPVEDSQTRKKRMIEQKQLIKKRIQLINNKNQQQRKQELQKFSEGKQQKSQEQIGQGFQEKISSEQLQRRRNLVKKLKDLCL